MLNREQYLAAVEQFLVHFGISAPATRSIVCIDVPGVMVIDQVSRHYTGPVTFYIDSDWTGQTDLPIGLLLNLFSKGVTGVGRVNELTLSIDKQVYRIIATKPGTSSRFTGTTQLRTPTLETVVYTLLVGLIGEPEKVDAGALGHYLECYRKVVNASPSETDFSNKKADPEINKLLKFIREAILFGVMESNLDLSEI